MGLGRFYGVSKNLRGIQEVPQRVSGSSGAFLCVLLAFWGSLGCFKGVTEIFRGIRRDLRGLQRVFRSISAGVKSDLGSPRGFHKVSVSLRGTSEELFRGSGSFLAIWWCTKGPQGNSGSFGKGD